MKTMLRNLARRYGSRMLVRANDALRRDLIGAQATVERLNQVLQHGEQGMGHAARALDEATAEIRKLTRHVAVAEQMLAEEKAAVQEQHALVRELTGRIECQADNHEADRAEWAEAKSRLTARVAELEQLLVQADADHAGLSGQLQDAGLDAAWRDVAAVSGPSSPKPYGRQ